LKAPEALSGMSGRNCKLIVVKPEKRGGYMPSQVMTNSIKEAKRRGIRNAGLGRGYLSPLGGMRLVREVPEKLRGSRTVPWPSER
jgi:hypothetical protein